MRRMYDSSDWKYVKQINVKAGEELPLTDGYYRVSCENRPGSTYDIVPDAGFIYITDFVHTEKTDTLIQDPEPRITLNCDGGAVSVWIAAGMCFIFTLQEV